MIPKTIDPLTAIALLKQARSRFPGTRILPVGENTEITQCYGHIIKRTNIGLVNRVCLWYNTPDGSTHLEVAS